ncbi:DUF2024 family protein [Candidatus Nitrosacidococcus sp. I8]|uniref:DUF2024 family protein n=1 Tax=Candidatus Nitrosacidococcus sp. I8 TaxID=2942908 RepID=UPI0022266A8B|nr:DUF2024 family protein [Candidatus Nitrosacidococcus sp. I8]CAH9017800.1 hypothetical protein NURINAE_00560 [Candidatus Nitrosacidococcus sp. I8]
MQIDVYDTYVTTTANKRLHFDVFLPTGKPEETAQQHASEWLKSIGIEAANIKQESCRYCHSESANPKVKDHIQQHGYYIFQMEGCPSPAR